jgi:hypothetical protein
MSNESAQDLMLFPNLRTLGKKTISHLTVTIIATTIETRRQEAPHMQGFGADNTEWISGSCLSKGFL